MPGVQDNSIKRSTALLAAIALAIIAGYGLWRLSVEYPRHWATIVPDASSDESPRLAIDRVLRSITDNEGRPRAGANVPLATFISRDGQRIAVNIVEGQFYDRSIEPHSSWQKLGTDILLVSSVDERRSARGGLGEATTLGCSLPPTPDATQALGESSIAPCGGIYKRHFGITRIARLSVIVDDNPGSDSPPCWKKFGLSLLENGYQDCVRKAVESSLDNLFGQINDQRYRPLHTIVFPAIGTGIGGLSKPAFYDELLRNALVPALKRGGLPSMTLYIQVTRYDTPQRWEDTRFAVASAVNEAVSDWETSDHAVPSSEWLTLTGVSLGGAALLFAMTMGWRRGALSAGFRDAIGSTPLSLLAWAAAAVGVASMFKAFVTLVPTSYGPYVQLGAGVIAALLAGPLTAASERAKDALKPRPAADVGDSSASAT